MSGHEIGFPALEGAVVVMNMERQLAVSHWLLGAAQDREAAREQWEQLDVALLACGGILSAVRVPSGLVRAAAGTEELEDVDIFLRCWFDGGAAVMDLHADQYYFLVPGSTAWRWTEREFPGVEYCGRDHYLGVPAPHLVERRGRSYWGLLMDSPGDLCYLDEVEELLKAGWKVRDAGGGPG